MDPLDVTTILVQAVQSVLQPSSISPAGVRRAELGDAEAPEGTRARPLRTSVLSPSRLARNRQASHSSTAPIQSHVGPASDNPRATLKAEELLGIASTDESSVPFRRRIATAAYLAEIEVRKELAKIRREGPPRIREWFA